VNAQGVVAVTTGGPLAVSIKMRQSSISFLKIKNMMITGNSMSIFVTVKIIIQSAKPKSFNEGFRSNLNENFVTVNSTELCYFSICSLNFKAIKL